MKKLTEGLMKNAKIEYLNESYNPKKAVKEANPAPVKKEEKKKQKSGYFLGDPGRWCCVDRVCSGVCRTYRL